MRVNLVFNDSAALRTATRLGLGVAMTAVPDILPDVESGELVRVLPGWWLDAAEISLYTSRELSPDKARAFVDFVLAAFEREDYARRVAGNLG